MKAIARREFIRNSGLAIVGLPFLGLPQLQTSDAYTPEIHVFSKHLQFLNFSEAAAVAASLGFAGIDLTVRPGGHVNPEHAPEELPAALESIRRSGSSCKLITTAVDDASDPVDAALLKAAANSGITHYRMNWYRYAEHEPMKETLRNYASKVAALSEMNKELGLTGCYQNHAGKMIGASMWELDMLLMSSNPNTMGIQYDIRHACVEGGLSWENGLRLVCNQIKTLVLKDFKWKYTQGRWQVVNTPIGEGMVDFIRYFKLLKEYGIRVPISLHLEYPLGGAEHGEAKLNVAHEMVYKAMKKDLDTIKHLWEEA